MRRNGGAYSTTLCFGALMSCKLQMLHTAKDYPCVQETDPLRFYYFPVIGGYYRKRVEMCLDLLPGGGSILEIGFGSGVSFLNLAKMYSEIAGIDLESNCEAVAACFAARGITTSLINGSAVRLPYPDNSFDSVLLISILEHLTSAELDKACSEIYRITRKGGVMVYGAPVERPLMRMAFRVLGYDIRKHHFSTERDIEFAVAKYMRRILKKQFKPMYGLVGAVYEACLWRKE